MKLPFIRFDCKYFEGDKPCLPNKNTGVFCGKCSYYEIGEAIAENFFPLGDALSSIPQFTGTIHILIIKFDAIGDVLRTTSIIPSLKQKYRDSHITWLTKLSSREILENNKSIDALQFIEKGFDASKSNVFDIAINLDSGRESCALMNNVIAEQKYGFVLVNGKPYPLNELANEWYLMGIDDNVKKSNTKTYHRIIHEICGLEYSNSKPYIEITPVLIERSQSIQKKFELNTYHRFILINLGGGNRWQYKKWTKEGYSELANRLSDNEDTAIGVIAGQEDRDFYNATLKMIYPGKNIIKLGCDNSTEDFISIIYLADKIFTSDSLALHIATAFNKYTVCITGPTSYTELDVFGNGKIIHSNKVDCLSCYLNTCDKKINCMNTVSAKDVIQYFYNKPI